MTTSAFVFELPRVVDSTMLDAGRVCLSKFQFEYGYGLRGGEPAVDLHAGGAFAAGRAAAYTQARFETLAKERLQGVVQPEVEMAERLQVAPIDAARIAFDEAWGDFTLPEGSKSPKTKAGTWAALVSYLRKYRPGEDAFTPFPTPDGRSPFELALSLPLTPETTGIGPWPLHPSGLPFLYAGRLDALGLVGGTLPAVLDDKTTARFVDATLWAKGLEMRAQFRGYTFLAQKLIDPRIEHVVVRQTAIRASGPEHREAGPFLVSKLDIAKWLETTRATLNAIVEADRVSLWPATLGDACTAWNRPCEFMGPCRARDPESKFDGFHVERWNPLSTATPAS